MAKAATTQGRTNQNTDLDVFSEVLRAEPTAVLAVLGEGHDRARIEGRSAELRLTDNVRLLGFREDVERWIATAEVCVIGSEREGLPRAAVQYALCARPMVVTDLPGIEAVLRDGRSGYLVPSDRLDLMAEPLMRLLADDDLRLDMARAAGQLDLSQWSSAHMVSELERLYVELLRRKGAL
ncbi:glycosyltransferase [Phenylobacterium sp.]|uniref:glycosyltransferase n=1 Tax=Phenylobacterium sp. TaxID=1871053 RepID=UPI003BABD901